MIFTFESSVTAPLHLFPSRAIPAGKITEYVPPPPQLKVMVSALAFGGIPTNNPEINARLKKKRFIFAAYAL